MLIPLICNQCGGKLEVEDTKVSISGDSFIVLPYQKFECPHCGTKYMSGDTNKYVHASGGGIAIGNLSFDGDVGNIVITSGVTSEASSINAAKSFTESSHTVIGHEVISATPSSKTKKQSKKWWEFWK